MNHLMVHALSGARQLLKSRAGCSHLKYSTDSSPCGYFKRARVLHWTQVKLMEYENRTLYQTTDACDRKILVLVHVFYLKSAAIHIFRVCASQNQNNACRSHID